LDHKQPKRLNDLPTLFDRLALKKTFITTIQLSTMSIIGLMTLLLSGCIIQPRVHLFTAKMNDQETVPVLQTLAKNNYEVIENHHEFPEIMMSDTIVFSLDSVSNQQILEMTNLIENLLGKKLNISYFGKGKHSFTKNNVGLYLFGNTSEKVQKTESISFLNEFAATHCDSIGYAYLTFFEEGKYELTTGTDNADQSIQNSHNGIWKKETSIITLFQDNEAQTSFRLIKIDELTQYGLKKGWALVPNENDAFIDNCEFEFTVILQY
jgi:Fe2+ transport system protein B